MGELARHQLLALIQLRRSSAVICLILAISSLIGTRRVEGAETFGVTLQRRDAVTGEIQRSSENLDPHKVGVVVVDMWNWHWCKTSTARVAALVPRMKKVVEAARQMGMTIFWCPSDVADNYIGTAPYEKAFAITPLPLPELTDLSCPPAPDGGGCTCGPERCLGNYGWDGMHSDLHMSDDDFMPNDLETLYTLCKQRGLTHIIYMGVHTQVCLLGKSIGLRNMVRAGFKCILSRDLTDAHGIYDPEHSITPDQFTADVVAHFERYLASTINFADELQKAGKWNPDWLTDPVRITPWGTRQRPHLFNEAITVTLSAPLEPKATIYYTLDGSEPTPNSHRYDGPFQVRASTDLHAAAYNGKKSVCLPSQAYFAKLMPMPPKPDVYIGDLEPARTVGPGHSPSSSDHRFSPVSSPPQRNRSNRGAVLRLRETNYDRGLGVHATNQSVYTIKPEYDRFVSLAGVDEHILEVSSGSNLAHFPSVIFKIVVDGVIVAESPVMRVSEQPWRFDVKLPPGSKKISLLATDAGDGNREDLANWVDAGFVLK